MPQRPPSPASTPPISSRGAGPPGRLRLGAWTAALVSLGVAVQGLYVTFAVIRQGGLARTETGGWLLAGSLGLAGSLLVALWIARRHLRR